MVIRSRHTNRNRPPNPLPFVVSRPRLINPFIATSGAKLYTTTNIGDTWQTHFTNRGWTTIQQQINAGYPYYAHPSPNGSYEEVFDVGVVITNSIISGSATRENVHEEVDVVTKIATSTDGTTYTPFVIGTTLFSESFRYIKIRLEFTPETDKSISIFTRLTVTVSVKEEVDSGNVNVLAADAASGGTLVNFKKPFKDVNSITTTALSTKEPYTALFNFVDVPNPTFFKVFVVDTSGNFVNATVNWKARGVI